jgi:prepilin peptidase CpaA
MSIDFFITGLLAFGMLIAGIMDLKTKRIPNLLTFPMMSFGFVYHGTINGLSGMGFSAAGVGVGIGVFLIPYVMGGMGAGDAKLMGAAGAFLGAKGTVIAAVMSVLIGLIYAIVLLFIHSDYACSFFRRVVMTLKSFILTRQFIPIPPSKHEKQLVLSYGVPIALGTICYLFLKITGSEFVLNLLGFQFSL